MIETLISSKTRIKLLLKFFLNSKTTAYLRSLESEFGESSNAIRVELNRLEKAGMLTSRQDGNKKRFQANTQHPLFREIHNILRKQIGLDHILEKVILRLGKVEKVYLTGHFARGIDSQVIELLFIGPDIDRNYLARLIVKVESAINRKINYLIFENETLNWAEIETEPFLLYAEDKL